MEKNSNDEQPVPSSGQEDSASNSIPAGSKQSGIDRHGSVSGVSASPPSFVAMEEIIKAAKGVNEMHIAHEIALDPGFCLKPVEIPQNSLAGVVKDMMHSAFWNILSEELKEDPPKYDQALHLLEEIKEILLGLLSSPHTKLKQEINEVLDVALIKQQAEQGTLNFHQYAQYVLDFMSKLCAPVRDEKIKELKTRTETIPIFLGIFETLTLMKMDYANFQIQMLRPVLRAHNVSFEKAKFAEFLQKVGGVDYLTETRKWLQRHIDRLDQADRGVSSDDALAVRRVCSKVLCAAYTDLVDWDPANKYPEVCKIMPTPPCGKTILMDDSRYLELQVQLKRLVVSGGALLLTLSRLQIPTLHSMQSFKEKLRQDVSLLLNGCRTDEDLVKVLPNVAVQIAEESRKCLAEHGPPGSAEYIDAQVEQELAEIIQGLSRPDQPIRQLVWLRIKEFLEKAITHTSDAASPLTQFPRGLSALRSDLLPLTGHFVRLVDYNRSVFGEYYLEIISKALKEQA